MILTLICLGVLIIGIVLTVLAYNYIINFEFGWTTGIFISIVGLVGTAICATCIIYSNVRVDYHIHQNEITYESLCNRLEIVNSEYEDISKSDVIKDISDWNKKVYSVKYNVESPWTNWLYSKKEADALKYIDIN